jgi:hypothetical protein
LVVRIRRRLPLVRLTLRAPPLLRLFLKTKDFAASSVRMEFHVYLSSTFLYINSGFLSIVPIKAKEL